MICGSVRPYDIILLRSISTWIFLGLAAEHGDIGDAGHDAQPALDDPVLDAS